MQEIAMQQTSPSEQRLLNCRIYSILQRMQAYYSQVRLALVQSAGSATNTFEINSHAIWLLQLLHWQSRIQIKCY